MSFDEVERGMVTLKRLPGRRVVSVARVLYEFRGRVDFNEGALQLGLDDGSVVLLDSEAKGDVLRAEEGTWTDPFLPLSEENRSYVELHGKWTRVECSKDPRYFQLINTVVLAVSLLENKFGDVAGAVIVAGATLWFVVGGDECYVHWAPPIGYRIAATFWPEHAPG